MKNYQALAVKSWRSGQASRFLVGLAGHKMIGSPGGIEGMATEIMRTPQLVRRLVRAYVTYKNVLYIWRFYPAIQASYPHPNLTRKRLNSEHYTELGEAWGRYDLEAWDVFATLQTAADEQLTAKAMREALDGEHRGDLPPQWFERLNVIADELVKLQGDAWVPDYVRLAASAYYKGFKRYLEKGYPVDKPPKGKVE